jgi:protein-S-isoprenylcysteine O-methyltransferase Ste14
VLKAALFVVATVTLGWVSRASLRRPDSHGFYRFFAWEFILAVILVNFRGAEQWFAEPFCLRQLVSWLLLLGSIVPVCVGAHQLQTGGRTEVVRDDPQLFKFEKTTHLVTDGLFKYVRHPLYSSLLLFAWGVFAKRLSWPGAGLALGATVCLVATAKVEEAENRRYFGTAYEHYMQRSKMFIPFIL